MGGAKKGREQLGEGRLSLPAIWICIRMFIAPKSDVSADVALPRGGFFIAH
jgi:hypothetical protein